MIRVQFSFLTYDDDFNWVTKRYISRNHTFHIRSNESVNGFLMRIVIASGFLFRYLKCGFETTDYFKIQYNEEAREIRDKTIMVNKLLQLYGKREHYDLILFWEYRPGGGAGVLYEGGIRFIIHTDEAIHLHDPHVHAEYNGNSMKISLGTLKCIGTLGNRKKDKTAKWIVEKNEDCFRRKWNEYVCGLSVDEVYYDAEESQLKKVQRG